MAEIDLALRVGGYLVGGNSPPFVIAEAGVNHNGSVDLAHRLIDVASQSGVQAVKFQIFSAGQVAHASAPMVEYQRRNVEATGQRELLRSLELPASAWRELREHAQEAGLVFLATAFDENSLNILLSLKPDALKIGSGDFNNRRLIEHTSEAGLPIIASTGLCTMAEVDRTAELLRGKGSTFALLHCVTSYPAPINEANLRVIPLLKARQRVVVGWSDHTLGQQSAVIARTLGAQIFERHFTIDRGWPGPDHAASSNPQELREYVRALAQVDAALGDGEKVPTEAELPLRVAVRRTHYATRDLVRGTILVESDTELLRPAVGLNAFELVTGRTLLCDRQAGDVLKSGDIADA